MSVAFANAKITGSYDESETYEAASVEKVSSSDWTTVAGGVPDSKDQNPFALVEFGNDVNSWSETEFSSSPSCCHAVSRIASMLMMMTWTSCPSSITWTSTVRSALQMAGRKLLPGRIVSQSQQKSAGALYPDFTANMQASDTADQPLWIGGGQTIFHFYASQKGDNSYSLAPRGRELYRLHASTDHSISFTHDPNNSPDSPQGDSNLFIVVPYSNKKGTDKKSMKYIMRNVATKEYIFIRDAPATKPPTKEWRCEEFVVNDICPREFVKRRKKAKFVVQRVLIIRIVKQVPSHFYVCHSVLGIAS